MLFRSLLAEIETGTGDPAAARRALVKATSVQPSNPETWQRLGCYDLQRGRSGRARAELGHAAALVPGQTEIRSNAAAFCATVNG